MRKFTLGFVCSGQKFTEMSMVSLYSVYSNIKKSYAFEKIVEEIMLVTDEPSNILISFAKSLHKNVRVISPSDWTNKGFPSYTGNYATYFKFDLLFNLAANKTLIYIDADAFVIKNLDLNFIVNRIESSSIRDSILMVPSHRPVIERIGFINKSNPFYYFNAGFMVITLRNKLTPNKLKNHLNYYPESLSLLTWADQDLINSYFGNIIEPLPLRYNVSTGMLKKTNFTRGYLNYLAAAELKQAVVAHASGGILYSKKYYPFRDFILAIARNAIEDSAVSEYHKSVFKKFFSEVNNNSGFKIKKLKQFLGLTPECSPALYLDNLYWKKALRRTFNRLLRLFIL